MKYENNLKTLCKIKGITANELAEKTKVSVATIQSLSSGRMNINKVQVGTLVDLAKGLDCKVSDLLADKKVKKQLQ